MQPVLVVASTCGEFDPVQIVLDGLATGESLDVLHDRVRAGALSATGPTARAVLQVAAAAFLACGASPADPLVFDELEERYLPDVPVRGNSAHQKRRHALTAAVLIAAGVEPESNGWWRVDDLWSHAFDAVLLFVRAASERRQLPIARICLALRDEQ